MSPAKSPIISGFFATKRRFFSVPKHRCKIAVFPLWIDLNSRKVNIRYARQIEIKNLSAFFITFIKEKIDMLQKELAKRLKARYDTKMDGNGWLEVSSDGIPLCRIKYNGQFLSNADKNLSDEYRSKIADIQDEISTVREYVGLYEHAPQMKADGVSDYRQLAAFGDTVLAATYNEKNGFMFCTWKQNADGDPVFWGDYSPNYEYVKEAFAVRSGLISKDRLFSENESAYLCRCVDFTKGNCETLTYEQERQLDKLQEKLTDGYPSLEAEPPTFEQKSAPQQNM